MARKRKFILQRMENVKKGREAFVNGKRRKIKGKENIPMREDVQDKTHTHRGEVGHIFINCDTPRYFRNSVLYMVIF